MITKQQALEFIYDISNKYYIDLEGTDLLVTKAEHIVCREAED